MAPRNKKVLRERKAIADSNERNGYRAKFDRDALYKTLGGFAPAAAPKGSGPPYNPSKMPRIKTPTKLQHG